MAENNDNNDNNENIDTSNTSNEIDKIDLLKSSINSEVFKYLKTSTSTSTNKF